MIVLEPKRLDERYIKLQQRNKRLLIENEVLDFEYLQIDNIWDFDLEPSLIKCKKINCSIILILNYIPSWIKDIEIDGYFYCNYCGLTSLENCPKIINRYFSCDYNKLESLDDGPNYVGTNYYCRNNVVKFTNEYVRYICKVKGNIVNIYIRMIVLEPRNIEKRILKAQQKNKRLLMNNEVLQIDGILFSIDKTWDFDLDPKLIKTKKIVNTVKLFLNHIPSWIKDIEIDKSFDCSCCNLTSLKNCPNIINGSFNCDVNKLTSLDDGPTFVGRSYWYRFNDVEFTKEYVYSICNINGIIM